MTRFSDTFCKLINEKHISIYNLAQTSGINRSTIQKFKSGDRIPKDEKKAAQLADHMMLSPTERNQFLKDFYISKTGETTYFRRQLVKEIIENFYDSRTSSNVVVETESHTSVKVTLDKEIIRGNYNVKKVLRAILETEAEKPTGYIKMLTQPEFTSAYECLSTIDFNKYHTPITNIITFDNAESGDGIIYNLQIFKMLVPLLFSCSSFTPYYIHESVRTLFNNTNVLPYKIITSEYAFFISYDQNEAVLITHPEFKQIAEERFQAKLLLSAPVYNKIVTNPDTYTQMTTKFMNFKATLNYSLLYQPSMPPFCDVQTMYQLINKKILTPELLQKWASHFHNLNNYSGTLNMQFTIEGLRLFLETGQVVEIPEFMLDHRPTPEQRVQIVRNFLEAIHKGRVKPVVLKTPLIKVPLPIVLVAYTKQNIVLHYFDQHNGIYFLTLQEISLVNAFFEFLEWNMDSEFTFSHTESIAMVERTLKDYLRLHGMR